MLNTKRLEELIIKNVIPDIQDRLDEIFEYIANSKEATQNEKEEIEELREFKNELEDILKDIKNGHISEDEAKEFVDDILEAQKYNNETLDL